MDVALATILVNIGERLYEDEGDTISSRLVLFDEWEGHDFIIHLQRNTRFSNGDLLQSYDVKYCLEQLIGHQKLSMIDMIETPSPLKIVIHFRERVENIKLILSQDFTTLYKYHDDHLLFTGPYRLVSLDETVAKLSKNHYYRQNNPDVTELIFTSDYKYYEDYTIQHNYHVLADQAYSSIDFMLFNPASSLNLVERQYITQLVDETNPEKIDISRPVKILKIKESNEWVSHFIDKLQNSIEIDIIEVPFNEYMNEPLQKMEPA